jgi:hypothetical protein
MIHKHADLIKKWVDGIECEYFQCEKWWDLDFLTQFEMFDDVRIKPEPKPDVVRYGYISCYLKCINLTPGCFEVDNIKLTFDGETGNLKSAEVIK